MTGNSNYIQESMGYRPKMINISVSDKEFMQVTFGSSINGNHQGMQIYKELLHAFLSKAEWHDRCRLMV